MSTERVMVDQEIADDFVAKLSAKAHTLPAGDPCKGNVVLGPLIGLDAAERVEGLVNDAVGKGAKLVAGGKRDGCIVAATVLDHVTPAVRIYHEESFGPIAPIIGVRDVKDHINGPTVQDEAQIPFSGTKASGYGRFGGQAAINEFTDVRWITVETEPHQYPF